MAIKEDGTDTDDIVVNDTRTGPATSQFVPPANPDASSTVLTEDEAERKGDFTALQRIKLANAAREANEHFDVNGDGYIATSLSSGEADYSATSALYAQDQYGGYYAKDGFYHDKFGGYYDDVSYNAKDGSVTTIGGEHWDAKTGKVTTAEGGDRPQTSDVVAEAMQTHPTIGRDQIKMDARLAQDEQAPGKPHEVEKPAAGRAAGGGLGARIAITPEIREKSDIILEGRVLRQEDTSKPPTADEKKHAQEVLNWRQQNFLSQQRALGETILATKAATGAIAATPQEMAQASAIVSERGRNGKPKFTAVSADVATTNIGHLHVPVATAAQTTPGNAAKKDGDAKVAQGATDNKGADQKAEATAAAGSTWYQDSRGGYWDEFGGYYDKQGGYWEADGGYWDKNNVYTDVNDGRTWPDGSYLDPNFNFVDAKGCYCMEDGTQIKPPAGMDFKKQMQEAAAKGEKWHLPEELVPLLQSKAPVLPELTLGTVSPVAPLLASSFAKDAPPKIEPVTKVETPVKLDPVPLKLEPVKLSTNLDLTPLKLNTGIGLPPATGTSFSLLDPKQNSTSAKPDSNFSGYQMCTAQGGEPKKNDFSSFFNNYHDFLTTEKPIGETRYYDLSNITLSPSIDPKPQLASLTTDKVVIPLPKTTLA